MKLSLLVLLLATQAHASLISGGDTVTSASALTDRQTETRRIIKSNVTNSLAVLKATRQQNFDQVWNNALGLTPQQALDALSTDACAAHQLFGAAGTIMNSVAPGVQSLSEPCAVTCNSDGSVTVGACQ